MDDADDDFPLFVCCDDEMDPVLPEDVDDDDSNGLFSAGLHERNESTMTGGRTGRTVCIPIMVPFGGNFPVALVVCCRCCSEKHCLKFCENYDCGFLSHPN